VDLGRGVSLGVADGLWSVASANGVIPLKADSDFARLLSLLEKPFEHVDEAIERYVKQEGLHVKSPAAKIVKAGLQSNSDYWVGLALAWYEKLPPDDRPELHGDLCAAAIGKGVGQKNRQIASRESKRLVPS
jgi:hypothetical protein